MPAAAYTAAAAAAAADAEYMKAMVGAGGAIAAALVAAIIGTVGAALITASLQRKRNEQDRESQWRTHAIELTKLDAERLMKGAAPDQRVLPFILTFLANYRDLQELGSRTPAELYLKIQTDRMNQPEAAQPAAPGTKPKPRRRKRSTKPAAPRRRRGSPPSRG